MNNNFENIFDLLLGKYNCKKCDDTCDCKKQNNNFNLFSLNDTLDEDRIKELKDAVESLKSDKLSSALCSALCGEDFISTVENLINVAENATRLPEEQTPAPTTTTTRKPSPSYYTPDAVKDKVRLYVNEYIKDVLSKEIKEECLLDKISEGLFEYTCWVYNHQ